jgi:hypothetical protein
MLAKVACGRHYHQKPCPSLRMPSQGARQFPGGAMRPLRVLVILAALCVPLALVVSTTYGGKGVALLLPSGSITKVPSTAIEAPAWALLLATLICGAIIGFALCNWNAQSPPRLTALSLCAIFFLGGATIVEAAVKYDPAVLRITLLLFLGALFVEGTRAEMRRFKVQSRPPLKWRPLLWGAAGIILAFAIPALLGDPTPFQSGLAICLVVGVLVAAILAASAMREVKWSAYRSTLSPPNFTVLSLCAIFFLGAAAIVEAAVKYDASVLRATLLLFVGALVVETTRAELRHFKVKPPPPSKHRRPLWLVSGIIFAFAIPALLGDPTPARSGLALGLGAGALAAAFAAARAMRKAGGLEVTSWAGGLGGGRATYRVSRAAGLFLLAVALAGAAAAIMSERPVPSTSAEEKAVAGRGGAQPGEAPKPPSGPAGKKD